MNPLIWICLIVAAFLTGCMFATQLHIGEAVMAGKPDFQQTRKQWVRDEHRRLCRDTEDLDLRRAELERDVKEFGLEELLAELDRNYQGL